MKKNAALVKEFNKKDSIIIIGNYPTFSEGKMGNITGISTYTFNLLENLKDRLILQDRKLIILADIVDDEKKLLYKENGVLIDRCWKKNTFGVFNQLYRAIKNYNNVSKILIHFEYNTYGSGLITGFFPFFLQKLHRNRKNVTLLVHQVVDSLQSLGGHLGLAPKSLKSKILDFLMNTFLWLLLGSVSKTVVHDSIFGERLNKIRRTPIYVVPHGMVDNSSKCDVEDFRKQLGLNKKDFIVLVFGFLTWYKGSDWIVDKFKSYYDKTHDKSIKLVLAGGKSHNLKGQKFYEDYYSNLTKDLENYPNILHTGFVPNEQIHEYFCVSDVVIFPYRTHMSASGPLSFALSFDRPFLLSDSLSSVLHTMDIKESVRSIGINYEDLVFKMGTSSSLFEKISNLISDKKLLNSLSLLSREIKDKRVWSRTAEKFLFLIDA